MMLCLWPPAILPTDTTTLSRALTLTRDHRLQRRDELGRHRYGVDPLVGRRAVPGRCPVMVTMKSSAAADIGPALTRDLAGRHRGIDVDSEHGVRPAAT